MKKKLKDILLSILVVCLFWTLMIILFLRVMTGTKITMTSISPDGQQSVVLEEEKFQFDRNFKVILRDINNDKKITLYNSPDEGRSTEKERFIWSLDCDYILLIGESLSIDNNAKLDTGENLYFLYQLSTQKSWCNASQKSGFPKFSKEDIKNLKFKDLIY